MMQHDLDRLKKVADLILADSGTPGYFTEVESAGGGDASIKLRLIEGYYSKPPSPAEIKPIAQALRTGLSRRGYQVKGTKPGVVREGTVYYYTIRGKEEDEPEPFRPKGRRRRS